LWHFNEKIVIAVLDFLQQQQITNGVSRCIHSNISQKASLWGGGGSN